MIDWPWESPQATRDGLSARLRNRYPQNELRLRQVEVAFRRLLVRLECADPGRWIVKGGVALLLRLDPNRTSDDIDLVYVDAAGEHALAVEALERAFAVDPADFFTFEFAVPVAEGVGELEDDTFSIRVRARIGISEWVSFGVDLARPAEDTPSELLKSAPSLTGLETVDALPHLYALPLPRQLAEKICAMFERHGASDSHSTRARDLIDVAMIAKQVDGILGDALDDDVRSEERRRIQRGSLPEALPRAFALSDAQTEDWRKRWSRATRGGPLTFDEALLVAVEFLTPVLAGDVRGRAWSRHDQAWK